MTQTGRCLAFACAIAAAILIYCPIAGAAEAPRGGDATPAGKPAAGPPRDASAGPAADDKVQRPGGASRQPDEHLRKWQNLPPEKRQELIERYRRFRELPEEERARIRERLSQWKNLSPEEKKRLFERKEGHGKMSPERRQRIGRRWGTWQSMTPEERASVRRALAVLKALPPEELQRLKSLPPDARRQALERILSEKGISLPERQSGGPDSLRGPGARPRGSERPRQDGPGDGRRRREGSQPR